MRGRECAFPIGSEVLNFLADSEDSITRVENPGRGMPGREILHRWPAGATCEVSADA